MSKLTFRRLRNTDLFDLYRKLISSVDMTYAEKEALLKIAVILLNLDEEKFRQLGYRIIVIYCNKFNDYKPLYDVAINTGYAPISKFIEKVPALSDAFEERFFDLFNSAYTENFQSGGKYLTRSQQALIRDFHDRKDETMAVVAPTSYGKSELYERFCREVNNDNICLLVPTKALLAQSKQRLLNALDKDDVRKIITHPDMFQDDGHPIIAILTQERLLRLLQKNENLDFGYVFVDEAHNLLDQETRSLLLAQVLILLNERNPFVAFKFLTPFLMETSNLSTRYVRHNIVPHVVEERIKTERFYLIDFRKNKSQGVFPFYFYDQFFNEYLELKKHEANHVFDFLNKEKAGKNIVYFNSPPKIERFAIKYTSAMQDVQASRVSEVCRELEGFIHPDFNLIRCIKKGIVYHHGSLPDIVKLYVEHIFSSVPEVSHVVTSSTLLEGVNIPAEKLFVMETKKGGRSLSRSQFQNLVGRVCRFSEIFNPENGSLNKLEPEIYVVGSEFCAANSNIHNFLTERTKIDKEVSEVPENVLLENTEIKDGENSDEKLEADETLENLSQGITGVSTSYANTPIGRLCFANNVTEIDILRSEEKMDRLVSSYTEQSLDTSSDILAAIVRVFIPFLRDTSERSVLKRLEHSSAQKFYAMFIDWRMRSASYAEMIASFMNYWRSVEDPLVYVDKWGDQNYYGQGHRDYWVNIRTKTEVERVNLAIVRIKEEQDFVDNYIIKFVEVLNELELVEEGIYLQIKYGTNDHKKITMINNGINNHLANILLDRYANYVRVNTQDKTVSITPAVIEMMQRNNENEIMIFETSFHIRG